MPLVLADRVQETTSTTGTGTLTLNGAVSGFQSFAAIGDGNSTYYAIVSDTNWEVGIGTYTSVGTTLSRDTVLDSSASGSLITVASGAFVFCDYPAKRAVYIPANSSSVAIGQNAGNTTQGAGAVAIGVQAGDETQGANAVAIGNGAGVNTQGGSAVAIGVDAAQSSQGTSTVAIGNGAGNDTQGNSAVAVGPNAGNTTQGENSVAIGNNAGDRSQGENSVAIGNSAGKGSVQFPTYISGGVVSTTLVVSSTTGIIPGMVITGTGFTSNRTVVSVTNATTLVISALANSTPSGTLTFTSKQDFSAVAIGTQAGQETQGSYAVAIGEVAGNSNQGGGAVAIGNGAGSITQGTQSVAVGNGAGYDIQGTAAVAIGLNAGSNTQNDNAVAIGLDAGNGSQGTNAIAIGKEAGFSNQGENAIAIGLNAGDATQPANSVILNASGVSLNGTNAGLYIDPVRNDTGSTTNAIYYNSATKELTYAPAAVIFDPVVFNDISNQTNGLKSVFDLKVDQNSITTIGDSKNLEVTVDGRKLAYYVSEQRYPWLTPYDSYKGFRVVTLGTTSQSLVIYNAPEIGSEVSITQINTSVNKQTRKYPYSATTIALGD